MASKKTKKRVSGPSGTNKTPRHNIRVPDPDGIAPMWDEMARSRGTTLGKLVFELLEKERSKSNR